MKSAQNLKKKNLEQIFYLKAIFFIQVNVLAQSYVNYTCLAISSSYNSMWWIAFDATFCDCQGNAQICIDSQATIL